MDSKTRAGLLAFGLVGGGVAALAIVVIALAPPATPDSPEPKATSARPRARSFADSRQASARPRPLSSESTPVASSDASGAAPTFGSLPNLKLPAIAAPVDEPSPPPSD